MFPVNFLAIERIGCQVDITSKKRVLEHLAKLMSGINPSLATSTKLFDRLMERERLGSTGIGDGIAIPHARLREINQAYGAFLQLKAGISFDAIDNKAVDMVFALVVPEAATQEHLQLLANLAAMFSDEDFCTQLRSAKTAAAILQLIQTQEAKLTP